MLCYLRQMKLEGFIWERTTDRSVKTEDCFSVNSIIYMIGLSYPFFSKIVGNVLFLGSGPYYRPRLLFEVKITSCGISKKGKFVTAVKKNLTGISTACQENNYGKFSLFLTCRC